jgi:hypothetical protein
MEAKETLRKVLLLSIGILNLTSGELDEIYM